MTRRVQFHELLKALLGSDKVYFQPPEDMILSYPCVVYSRSNVKSAYSDDSTYNTRTRYSVTVIDPNPDSDIPPKLALIPTAIFQRNYKQNNMNHDVYSIYY